MSSSIHAEGKTLSEALNDGLQRLGAESMAYVRWDYVREHFKEGAWTVLLEVALKSAEEMEAMTKEQARPVSQL